MIPTAYIELEQLGVLAIVGKSGTGKTSTIRFLISQLLLQESYIYVCDPHGKTLRENLTRSIEPLLPYVISAVSHGDRTQKIYEFGEKLQNRIDGVDTTSYPIVLILDEAPAHFMQCSTEELKRQSDILLKTANEGRKVGVHAILLLQNVKKDFIGSRSIRSSLTHILFHRINEEEIKLLVQSLPNEIRNDIVRLRIGRAVLYPELKRITIPFIDNDETIHFEKIYRNRLITRDTQRDRVHDVRDQYRDRTDHEMVMPKSDIFLYQRDRYRKHIKCAKKPRNTYKEKNDHDDHAITIDQGSQKEKEVHEHAERKKQKELSPAMMKKFHDLRMSIKKGESKEKAIYRIFGIRKGGKSKNWILMSGIYDKIKSLDVP